MARPRKTDSDELIEILDAFFTTEAAGNPAKLKCSLLEEYAAKLGKEIKAYDFRRDEKVRQHIEELKALVRNENGMGIQLGNPYKNLDVTRIMRARQNPDALRTVLGELDDYWRHIYESTLKIRLNAGTITAEKTKLEKEFVALRQENETLTKKYTDSKADNRKLTVENRYLKKVLRTYLYPALANEILTEENQIKNPDTEVIPYAKEKLIDGNFPSSVSNILSEDRGILSQAEELLKQMCDSIPEGTV